MSSASRRRTLSPSLLVVALALCAASVATPAPAAVGIERAAMQGELVAVNGTELFVLRLNEGGGEPILIVHGGPVLEHGYLEPWLAPLADGHELVFYDQRLSGRSAGEVDPESVRVATFVDDIEALRVTLGLGRIHLLGHSWGGHLAMQYAIRHGESLRSLLLLDSMAASSALWQQEQAVLAERISEQDRAEMERLRGSEAVAAGDPEAIARLLLASFRAQFHDRAKLDSLRLYVPDDYLSRSRQFGTMMVDLTDFDLHERLAEISAPTLVLYGAGEPGLEHGGRAILEHIPGAQLVVIEDAGHFPFLEQPETTLAAIREFLSRAAAS